MQASRARGSRNHFYYDSLIRLFFFCFWLIRGGLTEIYRFLKTRYRSYKRQSRALHVGRDDNAI